MGTAFNYAAAIGEDVSFWLLLLYDYFFWAGTIDERIPNGQIDGKSPREEDWSLSARSIQRADEALKISLGLVKL